MSNKMKKTIQVKALQDQLLTVRFLTNKIFDDHIFVFLVNNNNFCFHIIVFDNFTCQND